MKLAIRRESVQGVPGAAAPQGPANESSIDVPTSTVAKLSAILAAVLTLSQILSTVVSSITGAYSNKTQVEASKEVTGLVDDNFRVQLLQRILEEPNDQKRAKSLQLLLASGLIKDPGGKMSSLVGNPNYVPPQWGVQPIEPLKDTLSLAKGNPPTSSAGQGGQAENMNKNVAANTNSNPGANTNKNAANDNHSGG